MNFKRVCKSALCLLVACFLVFNIVSIPARATGVGATAAITAAGTVLSPVGMIVGATFVALGLAAAANPEGFQNMVDAGVSALESASTWVKDGMVELLRTEDADGNASYYVDSGMMQDVRSWVFSESATASGPVVYEGSTIAKNIKAGTLVYSGQAKDSYYKDFRYFYASKDCYVANFYVLDSLSDGYKIYYANLFVSDSLFNVRSRIGSYEQNLGDARKTSDGLYYYVASSSKSNLSDSELSEYLGRLNGFVRCSFSQPVQSSDVLNYFIPSIPNALESSFDLSIGSVPSRSSDLTDGTSARQWSEEYASHAILVNPSPDSGDDYKLYYPLVLPPSLSDLYSSTQADQWTGVSSPGFTDYEEKEDYLIHDLPIVDGYQGVVVSPADKESDTESGTQSGTTTGAVTLPGWLSEGISNLLQGLKDILSGILALPAAIAEALAAVFIPSADYITAKVDALRGEFGFIDSVIATGEFIRDSVSGASGPPAIYVNLGNAPSGNYGSQRVLLTDFSWYAPYKSQVDTVLSAALWAFFGWKVFLNLPSIIGGESGYISDIAFYESGGYYGGRAREIRSGRGSRSKGKGGK